MSGVILILAVGALMVFVRILHLASQAVPPFLYYKDTPFNKSILQQCSILLEAYVPPLLWGKSGHIQTIVYGKMGRVNSPFPQGERHLVELPDGSTMSYDVFEPHIQHPSGGDYSMLFCPGIANSSESLYICTCVHYAQSHGFRVAVLNHLGCPKGLPLTFDRVFNYGSTEEFNEMFQGILESYPYTQCIPIGFSMGGNIVVKWLADHPHQQDKVLAAMSCCQGYNAESTASNLLSWEHMRRIYLWAMTLHSKAVLRRHKDILFCDEALERHPGIDQDRVWSATSLQELDRYYTAPRLGFQDEVDYYRSTSCADIMHKISVPMLLLNALDDPIIPPELLQPPKNAALSHDNVIFATTQHGGHLGFFEGGLLYPDTITWLDKIVVQYSNAMVNTVGKAKQFQSPLSSSASIDKLLNTTELSDKMDDFHDDLKDFEETTKENIEPTTQKSQFLQSKAAAGSCSDGELRKRGFTVEDGNHGNHTTHHGRKNEEEEHIESAPLLVQMDPPRLNQSSSQLLSQ